MCCHLVDAVTKSSQGRSIILSDQLLENGAHGKNSEFHEHEPTAAGFFAVK